MRNYLSKKLKIIFNKELYENLKLEIKILEEEKKKKIIYYWRNQWFLVRNDNFYLERLKQKANFEINRVLRSCDTFDVRHRKFLMWCNTHLGGKHKTGNCYFIYIVYYLFVLSKFTIYVAIARNFLFLEAS